MSEIEHDQIVNRVNELLGELGGKINLSAVKRQKMVRLRILIGRYLNGERTEELFEAMKTEIKENA